MVVIHFILYYLTIFLLYKRIFTDIFLNKIKNGSTK
jgi:hypothetical protein